MFAGRVRQTEKRERDSTRVYRIKVDVDGLGGVGVDLHHGWGGKHQDMGARRVLRCTELRRLHVQRGAATKDWPSRHRVCRGETNLVRTLKLAYLWPQTSGFLFFFTFFVLFLPGRITKDPCGSMATRQALRMLGVSAADIPHIRHVSFRRLLRDWRFRLLSKMLQSEKEPGRRDCICSSRKCLYLHHIWPKSKGCNDASWIQTQKSSVSEILKTFW